ncbi:Protein CBR-GEI-14 [Caenorhabditis briggsae]|uniref:Protein CBR-GEI-14 n=2 Tax=Caenorhabditis briggsae TaxID=6238 RepID=A8WNB8_CAEBR|nr:Protein CBR-GEI-14 [Caenorhabditis briggsae]ULU04443.1 hypothetical protein L3Y34_017307 [Caenorhabditis briggsae]CAP21972.1 Protein CBR-GEI-14 [Caenorhabditis briggsae]
MKRRGINWKPRLSAGGANRTNMQGIMSRYQQQPPPEEAQVISDRGSDLMPIRRGNSFRPFESRLQPHYRSPPRCYSSGYWKPPPPPIHPAHPPRYGAREPDVLLNDKGRPIPRRGMFLNAKYSAPPPEIDEERVRHTEDVIRRMVRKSRRSEQFSLNAPSNYQLRDSIRQAVYDQGVPDYFRVREPIYDDYEDVRAPRNQRPSSSHHHSATYSMSSRHHPRPSSRYSRGDRRVEFEEDEEDGGYDSDEEEVFEPPPKKQMKRSRYGVDEEERPSRKIRRHHRHVEEERGSSSNEDDVGNRSSNSRVSKASEASRASNKRPNTPEDRPPSCGSKKSTPTPGKYIKDSDPEDEIDWKRGVPFMCDERGAAVLDRVGSAIQRLPLRDDAKNSYSQVAMMLLERSMKNLEKPAAKESFRPQSRLQDMTGSWERTPRQKSPEAVSDALQKTSILRDISKIQHPQNASTLQIDQSLFAIPRLYDVDVVIDEDWMSRKKTRMPPPLHRSSPLSTDVFRSDDVITAPSSIRKEAEVEMAPIQSSFFIANPDFTCNESLGGSMITSLDPRDFGSRTMHFNAQFEFSPRRKKGAVKPMVDMDEEGEKEMEKEFSRMSNQARFAF